MWQKPIKKTIFLLNIGNYAPELTALTYPRIEKYAKRIGADIFIIKDRKFPAWDLDYEKLQIYELAQKMENDWNIYIDSDALLHPELPDFTELIPMDTVAHKAVDVANIRWKYDRFFLRDGRNIGSCNWLTVASSWCIELWKPLDDLTPEEAVSRIYPIVKERKADIKASHLISDFTLSRNIAKYGLKVTTLNDIWTKLGIPKANFFCHPFPATLKEKISAAKKAIGEWGI